MQELIAAYERNRKVRKIASSEPAVPTTIKTAFGWRPSNPVVTTGPLAIGDTLVSWLANSILNYRNPLVPTFNLDVSRFSRCFSLKAFIFSKVVVIDLEAFQYYSIHLLRDGGQHLNAHPRILI